MAQAKRPGVALIGCGRWGQNYLQHLGDYWDEVHVLDFDRSRLVEIAKSYPDYRFHEHEEELEKIPALDAIICVPPQITPDKVRRWINLADRLLVEKPYFHKRSGLFEEMGLRDGCYIGHIRLQTPLMRFLDEYHSDDEAHSVTFTRKLAERRFGDIGLMPDLFIHDIAVVFRTLGPKINDLKFGHYEETLHFLEIVLAGADGSNYTFRYLTDSSEREDQVVLARGPLNVLLDERKTAVIEEGKAERDLSGDISPLEKQVQKFAHENLKSIDLFSFGEMVELEKFFETTFGDRAFTGL